MSGAQFAASTTSPRGHHQQQQSNSIHNNNNNYGVVPPIIISPLSPTISEKQQQQHGIQSTLSSLSNTTMMGSVTMTNQPTGSSLNANTATNNTTTANANMINNRRASNVSEFPYSVIDSKAGLESYFENYKNDNASLAETSNSTNSITDFYKVSLFSKFEERMFLFLLSLQNLNEKLKTKDSLKNLILISYFTWSILAMGIQSTYNYGEYGQWIARALNFPITFGFEYLPYIASIILSSILFSILVLQFILLLVSYRSVYTMSKYWNRIKQVTTIINGIIGFFHLPISWLLLGYLKCDYSSLVILQDMSIATPKQVLYRYPNIACYGNTNIVFMIISGISFILMNISLIIAVFTITDKHVKSKSIFNSYNITTYLFDISSQQVFYLLLNTVSHDYLIIQASLFLAMRFALSIYFLMTIPFYNRLQNSIYFGINCATVASGISGIISIYVNLDNSYDLGLGLIGMHLGSMILFFIGGLIGCEIYLKIKTSQIKNIIVNHAESKMEDSDILHQVIEREACSIAQQIDDLKLTNSLYLYLKFSTKKRDLTDLEICKSFIKGLSSQKSFQSVYILLISSIILGNFCEDCCPKALLLLKKGRKTSPNFLQRLWLLERSKEIESLLDLDGRNVLDIKHILLKLEKKHIVISSLHKAFWKEMLQESISLNKIESLNKQITSITRECDIIFNGLIANYGNNKTVLRTYAKYLDEIKFEKEKAFDMYDEATSIEDEESKKVTFMIQSPTNQFSQMNQIVKNSKHLVGFYRRKKTKTNRILPNIHNHYNNYTLTSNNNNTNNNTNNNLNTTSNVASTNNENNSASSGLNHVEDSETFDGIENSQYQKKEYQFRSSLNRQTDHVAHLTFFIVLSVLSFIVLTIGIGMSISFSKQMTSNIEFSYYHCMPTAIPRFLLREVRTQQNFMYLFDKYKKEIINASSINNISPSSLSTPLLTNSDSILIFNQDHKIRLNRYNQVLQELATVAINKFTTEMVYDYRNTIYSLYSPVLFYTNTSKSPANYTQNRNSSISEITDLLIKYTNNYLEYNSMDQYLQSTISPDFMFYWSNRKDHSNAYDAYCDLFLKRNSQTVSSLSNEFILYYSISISVYVVCAASVVVLSLFNLRQLRSSIKFISKSISKDIFGKIYQFLDKKIDEEIDIKNINYFSKPQTSISSVVLITILITILCITMFFIDMQLSSQSASVAINNISQGTNILRTANRISFRFSELFTFLKYPSRFWLNDARLMTQSELDNFHVQNKELTGIIKKSWDILYLDHTFVDVYEDMDNIIFPSRNNCSIYSNISSIYGKNTTNSGGYNNFNYKSTTEQYSTQSPMMKYQCMDMNSLITDIIAASNRIGEDLFYSNYKLIDEFINVLQHYEKTNVLMDKMLHLFNLYTKYTSLPDSTITIIFSILGYISLVVLTYFNYSFLKDYWDQNQQLRSLLNYIPLDTLENNETLRMFTLFNQLPNSILSKSSQSKTNQDKVNSIVNSAIEGIVLCNSRGEIELFNPAAQKMFGMNNSDVLGQSLVILFDRNDSMNFKKLEILLHEMKLFTDSTGTFSELLEIECIRKNQSKFPSKINIFVSIHNKKPLISCFIKDYTPEKKQNILLAEEKKKSENLLLNIMPENVANQLKQGETFIAEKYGDVSVFFSDMVGFTKISSRMNPSDLVKMLNIIVNGFDLLTDKFNLEKIKTIGDAYFCVGGIGLNTQSDHPERMLKFSIETMTVIQNYNQHHASTLSFNQLVNIRCGINTGSVVAGVIGIKKFAYDLWGDTINTASRMESTSSPGRIQISRSTYERVYDLGYEFEERKVDVKGKGLCQTYMLKQKHHIDPINIQNIDNLNNTNIDNNTIDHNTNNKEKEGDESVLPLNSTILASLIVQDQQHNENVLIVGSDGDGGNSPTLEEIEVETLRKVNTH